MERASSFIVLKKDDGTLSNAKLEDKLANGEAVNEYNIINHTNQMKFVDSNPPIIYTMMIIWDHIFKTFLTIDQHRQLRGNKTIEINVTPTVIHERLNRFAPETNPTCIQRSWVENALIGFTEIGLAEPSKTMGEFIIKFRVNRGKTLDWLFQKIDEHKVKVQETKLDNFF